MAVINTVGRRKTSTARVRLLEPGKGSIVINGLNAAAYLERPVLEMIIMEPLEVTQSALKFDIIYTR